MGIQDKSGYKRALIGEGLSTKARLEINLLMREQNLTGVGLAQTIGMDSNNLSEMLNGEKDITLQDFAVIMMGMGKKVEIVVTDF